MVGVRRVAPIGARLASRAVRPRRVSAKRSWPPGCGRFPAAPSAPGCGRFPAAPSAPGGDRAKGVIEDRVEEAMASQPETKGTVDVRKEGVGDARGQAERESRAIEVTPPASVAPRSSAVIAVSGSAENGAEPLPAEGSGQLGREEVVAGNPNGRARAADDALETVRKKKRWLMSAVNPAPKRRAISAVRKFPPGFASCCHRPPAAELMKG